MMSIYAAIAALAPLVFFVIGYRIGLARYRGYRDELDAEWELIDRLRNAHEEFLKVFHRWAASQRLHGTHVRIHGDTSHDEVERLEKEANLAAT